MTPTAFATFVLFYTDQHVQPLESRLGGSSPLSGVAIIRGKQWAVRIRIYYEKYPFPHHRDAAWYPDITHRLPSSERNDRRYCQPSTAIGGHKIVRNLRRLSPYDEMTIAIYPIRSSTLIAIERRGPYHLRQSNQHHKGRNVQKTM